MGRIDNLTENNELADLKRRVRELETRNPLSDSAVSGGRTRFIGANSFLIEGSGGVSGTLTIDGLEIVKGELRISGSLNVTGPTNISGNTTVTGAFHVTGPATIDGKTTINGDTTVKGPFHIDGDTDVDGKLDINGDSTLSGDLTVDDNGRINVGGMTIGKFGGRGKVDFGTAELASDGTRAAIQAGSALVGARVGAAMLLYAGNGFVADSGGLYIANLPSTDQPPNLYCDPNGGKLYRSTNTGGGVSV
jgi:cytoskeletal protein CcmA (bactofilin family)